MRTSRPCLRTDEITIVLRGDAKCDCLTCAAERSTGYIVNQKGDRGRIAYPKNDFIARLDRLTKVDADARYDGLWVLRTNTTLAPRYVALAYRQL